MGVTGTQSAFRLLGELEVEGVPGARLGGPKQRALLVYLLLHADELVPRDRLVDAVWGERAPATARSIVYGYVRKLRAALEGTGARIASRAGGYVLEVDAGRIDARRFERLVVEGGEALAADEPERAQALLADGLALWRGQPLADLAYEPSVEQEVRRLEELRLEAIMDWADAGLALGAGCGLVGELQALVSRHPYRERLRGQLMVALYRSGRQAEALDAYRQGRVVMEAELGLQASRALRELEQQILRQDPILDLSAARSEGATAPLDPVNENGRPALAASAVDDAARLRTEATALDTSPTRLGLPPPQAAATNADHATGGPNRRQVGAMVAAAALVVVLAAVVALALNAKSGGGGGVRIRPNSVAVLDPRTGQVRDDVSVGNSPGPVAVGDGAVWIGNLGDSTLMRLDPLTRTVKRTIPLDEPALAVAEAPGAVWIGQGPPLKLTRVSPSNNDVVTTIKPCGSPTAPSANNLGPHGQEWQPANSCFGARAVWAGQHEVWIAGEAAGATVLARIDAATNRVARLIVLPVGSPAALAAAGPWLWLAAGGSNGVIQIDRATGHVVRTIGVGEVPSSVAADSQSVWVSALYGNSVLQASATSPGVAPAILAVTQVGKRPVAIALGQGALWVANSEDGTVSRIDIQSGAVKTIKIGQNPVGIAAGAGAVWVTVQAAPQH